MLERLRSLCDKDVDPKVDGTGGNEKKSPGCLGYN